MKALNKKNHLSQKLSTVPFIVFDGRQGRAIIKFINSMAFLSSDAMEFDFLFSLLKLSG